MLNNVKNSTFFPKFQILDLIWHVIQKSAKIHKNEKTQHLRGHFKSKQQFKNSKLSFRILEKVGKNVFFVIFSKMANLVKN